MAFLFLQLSLYIPVTLKVQKRGLQVSGPLKSFGGFRMELDLRLFFRECQRNLRVQAPGFRVKGFIVFNPYIHQDPGVVVPELLAFSDQAQSLLFEAIFQTLVNVGLKQLTKDFFPVVRIGHQ